MSAIVKIFHISWKKKVVEEIIVIVRAVILEQINSCNIH